MTEQLSNVPILTDDFQEVGNRYHDAIVSLNRNIKKNGYDIKIRYAFTNQCIWRRNFTNFEDAQKKFNEICDVLNYELKVITL